ncbi:MAG: hypothetical protein WCG25_06305 [bacterium]
MIAFIAHTDQAETHVTRAADATVPSHQVSNHVTKDIHTNHHV